MRNTINVIKVPRKSPVAGNCIQGLVGCLCTPVGRLAVEIAVLAVEVAVLAALGAGLVIAAGVLGDSATNAHVQAECADTWKA
jgi:hypothetical protein